VRHVCAIACSHWLAAQSGKGLKTALRLAPAGILCVAGSQVTVVLRLDLTAFVFLHVATIQNPFAPKRGQAVCNAATRALITPRPAGVINPDRLIRFDVAVETFGGMQSNFAERHTNLRMQFSGNVNPGRARKLVGALRSDRIFVRDHNFTFLMRTCGLEVSPFASIIWSRFDGSIALPRKTLSLCPKPGRVGSP
jgi:hypothetical protein